MSASATSLIFDLLGRDVSASATVQAFGAEVEKTSGGASAAFSKAATGITVAAAAAVAESVRMAANFQTQMTRLVTAAGESESNLQMVSDGVLAISNATGVSTNDLATAMYQVESAGDHGADGLTVLKAAAQGAQVEGANATTVANALTTALDDMHKPASDAANVMSQMVAAVGQGKMTMDDLAGSLHSVLPNATALGLSFPQVAGALAEMTSQGMSADQAAENLNHTIVSLASPTQGMTAAMAAYGLSSQQVAKSLGTAGLTGTMQQLSTAVMSKMGPAGVTLLNSFNQSQAAANDLQVMLKAMPASMDKLASSYLAGTTSFSTFRTAVRATGGVSEATGTQFLALAQKAQGFNSILASGNNASQTYTAAMKSILGDQTNLQVAMHLTGAATAGFNSKVQAIAGASADASGNVADWTTKQKTLNIQIDELTATVKDAGIELGTKLLPDMTSFVHLISTHIVVVGEAALGLVALGVAYKTVQLAIKLAQGAQLAFNGIMIVTKGIYAATQGTMLGFKAGMMGLQALTEVQTASLERSTVAMVAFKVAQMASAAATKVMSAATAVLDAVLDANPIILIVAALVALGVGLYEAYEHSTTFRNIVNAAFKDVKAVALDVFHALETAFNDTWHAMQDAWDNVGVPIFDVIKDVIGVFVDYFKIQFLMAVVVIGFVWDFLKLVWNDTGKPTFDAIASAAQFMWSIVKEIFSLWLDQWKILWAGLELAWNTVGVPIVNAIKDTFDVVWSALQTAWTAVKSGVFDAMQDTWTAVWGSLQTVWTSVGKPIFDGIEKATSAVGNGLQWAYNNVLKPTGTLIAAVWSGISSGWNSMVGELGNIGSAVEKPIVSAINGMIGIINEVIGGMNKISVTVPSWSPIDGGKTFGIHLSTIPSVKLAEGATIKATPGGTLATLGEGGKDETVVDAGLMNSIMAKVLADQQSDGPQYGQSPTIINVTVAPTFGTTPNDVARQMLQALQQLKGQGVKLNLG
uniref:Phage tail tape measure protein domain-containing protein n=1 Tax=uncultured organism TaxID=155900 RepID=A0A7L9QCP3_9ZZZZ|nr:hypothetical protein [uncultured organism]